MKRVALALLLATTGCAATLVPSRDRLHVELRYVNKTLQLRQSLVVAPFFRDDARRLLLQQFNRARAQLEQTASVRSLDPHQQRAWSLLTSSRIHTALDIHQETPAVRERYGPTLFGQAMLAARRIVEQGGRFVSVFWDPFGPFGGSVWDTHANHFPRLKNYLP